MFDEVLIREGNGLNWNTSIQKCYRCYSLQIFHFFFKIKPLRATQNSRNEQLLYFCFLFFFVVFLSSIHSFRNRFYGSSDYIFLNNLTQNNVTLFMVRTYMYNITVAHKVVEKPRSVTFLFLGFIPLSNAVKVIRDASQ